MHTSEINYDDKGELMNICAVCKNLVRYYTKELKQFDKSEFGWCCEKRQVVCVKGTCEHFEKRTYRR